MYRFFPFIEHSRMIHYYYFIINSVQQIICNTSIQSSPSSPQHYYKRIVKYMIR